ncbi:hypothetical protein [Schumannella luteola]
MEFLSPVIEGLQRLVVTDFRCTSVDVLRIAVNLRELSLWVVPETEVPFEAMPNLESYAGFGRRIASLPTVTSLQTVYIEGVSDATLRDAVGPLNDITLTRGNALTSVPRLAHPERVSSLFIQGTRRLDVSGLSSYSQLKRLHVAACKSMVGVEGLLSHRFESVELEKCASIEDFPTLTGIQADTVTVAGPSPFDDEFKEMVASRHPGRWSFPN